MDDQDFEPLTAGQIQKWGGSYSSCSPPLSSSFHSSSPNSLSLSHQYYHHIMASPILSTFVVPITVLLMGLGCFSSSSLLLALPISTISSAPALLPIPPLSSPPTLPPDITPLFPTPGGDLGPSPSQPSSIPTIPSSPSPPNPDQMGFAPVLSVGFAPSEPTPGPSSVAVAPSGSPDSIVFLGLMVFWLLLQLSGL